MDTKEIKSLIDKYKFISFDVFDTLLKRNVHKNEDIFYFVEQQYKKKYNKAIDFTKQRISAEKNARENGEYYEVNLDEIYIELAKVYKKESTEELKQMEIQAEINFSIQSNEIFDIFEYCKKKKKTIYIISDMYLPCGVINKMLASCGYSGYIKIYDSCEYRKTKWQSGELYKCVLQENNLTGLDLLHIGNDYKADYLMAKKQGITPYLINPERGKIRYFNKSDLDFNQQKIYSSLKLFVGNVNSGECHTNSYNIGFENYGPLLAGYSKWLLNQLQMHNINKVYFFSRDGYILKKGFDLLCSEIQSYYFYVSRKSIITALLCFDDNMKDMLSHYRSLPKEFTLEFFFDKIGLNFKEFEPICTQFNLQKSNKFTLQELVDNQKIYALFQILKPYIYENSRKALNLFTRYIKQNQMQGRIAMVDIGAGCSIECAFRKIIKDTNIDIDLWSFNLQTAELETERRKNYIDTSKQNQKVFVTLRFCYMLLEVFCSAPHGTVLGYKFDKNRVKPILGNFKYDNSIGNDNEIQMIQELQQGALDFVKKISCKLIMELDITGNMAIKCFAEFGILPKMEDVKEWGRLRFDSDWFGPLVKNNSLFIYLMHPKKFKEDLNQTMWLSGFIRKCLHFNVFNIILYHLYKMKL